MKRDSAIHFFWSVIRFAAIIVIPISLYGIYRAHGFDSGDSVRLISLPLLLVIILESKV